MIHISSGSGTEQPIIPDFGRFRLDDEITADVPKKIIDIINEVMHERRRNVGILYDTGNGSWICLKYQPKNRALEQKESITFFTPTPVVDFEWSKLDRLDVLEKMKRLFPNLKASDPWEIILVDNCTKYKSPDLASHFRLVLAYALGAEVETAHINALLGMSNEQDIRAFVRNLMTSATTA